MLGSPILVGFYHRFKLVKNKQSKQPFYVLGPLKLCLELICYIVPQ